MPRGSSALFSKHRSRDRHSVRAGSGKVDAGFPKRSCANKEIERDDDSKKSHHALGAPTRKMPAEQLDQPWGIHSSGEAGLTLVRATFYGSEVVDIGAGCAGPFIFVIVKKLST